VRVVVTGAAGQTGRLIVDLLVAAGHDVVGVVRRPDQAEGLAHAGVAAYLADLTQVAPVELESLYTGADAGVWAAGAGYGADPDQVDGEACIHAQQVADEVGVARWVQVSSMYADRPDQGPPFLQRVLTAKNRADTALDGRALGWTVVRPGGLTDEAPTGLVELGVGLISGTLPRADLAAVVAACLDHPGTARRSFDLVAGAVPVVHALAAL
jgi:uncharacterized protein YbjT (DUF2867 family)